MGIQVAVKYSSPPLTYFCSLLDVEDWFTHWHIMTCKKTGIFTYTSLLTAILNVHLVKNRDMSIPARLQQFLFWSVKCIKS